MQIHPVDHDMFPVSYMDPDLYFLLLRIGGNHTPG